MSGSLASPPAAAPLKPFGAAEPRHYRVFLSYSHADTRWARWLMRRLEGYRVSSRFHGRSAPIGEVGPWIGPVFRDRDELPTTSDLGETIRQALRQSATLVVVASPASARSRWVRQEILEFKRLGGERRVFAFIIDGEPKIEGAADDCFSPALRFELGPDGQLSEAPAEVVAADARPEGDGRNLAFVRLVAGLLGVGFDELRQRELQRRHRRMTLIAAGSVLGMAMTLWLAAMASVARDDARRRQEQAEDLLAFMLGDLRMQLDRVGRLDVLEAVGDKAKAYFASLVSRDLNDSTLNGRVKALTLIAAIRVQQARYPEAMTELTQAYTLADTLARRHPRDGNILFDRGQAEYWIGYIHRKRGELSSMGKWLTRYRDTGMALIALDPTRSTWQEELAYGHHNLAVFDLDSEKLASARDGFLAELEILLNLLRARPNDLMLQFRIVDADSWLGSIAERSGDYGEAAARFAEQVSRMEAIARADPGNAKWRAKLADGLSLHSGILAITGQRSAALERRGRAKALFDALVAGDPRNRAWETASLSLRLKEARVLRAEGEMTKAARLIDESREKLEKLAVAAPSDRDLAGRLATARRLQAESFDELGRPDAARAAAQAVELGESLILQARANIEILGETAQALVVAGRLAAQSGAADDALRRWQRAIELLEPRLARSQDWRLLDAGARALAFVGRHAESRAMIAHLRQLGYVALEPWPEATDSTFPVRNINPQSR